VAFLEEQLVTGLVLIETSALLVILLLRCFLTLSCSVFYVVNLSACVQAGLLQRHFGGLFINCSEQSAVGLECGGSLRAAATEVRRVTATCATYMYFSGYLYGSGLSLSCL